LSNIYLHKVLDEWFEGEVKPKLQGRAELIRWADDYVILFTNEQDAYRVWKVLPKRFGKYGLALHEEKTRLIDFHPPRGSRRKSETFVFLGFTHFWGKSRKGKWVMKRKTARKKLKESMRRVYEWCKMHRHDPVKDQWEALCRKLLGHYGFYGVTFNARSLKLFYEQVKRLWRKWLNRRSRKNDMPWERFNRLLERYPLPRPRIVHKFAQ
jgi:RNA-directed DNA polymerase